MGFPHCFMQLGPPSVPDTVRARFPFIFRDLRRIPPQRKEVSHRTVRPTAWPNHRTRSSSSVFMLRRAVLVSVIILSKHVFLPDEKMKRHFDIMF